MPKNASEVILVPKNIVFLKFLNFVQSFVECKVSLAGGNFELVDETLIFQGHLNFFEARSWLRCAPVDGLTKNVVKQSV
jgi:hypothetical protein